MAERPRWYRRTRTVEVSVARVAWWLTLATIVCLVLAGLAFAARAPVLNAIGRQLVHTDPLERVDVLIVLSGGAPVRELEAAELYRTGWARRILLPAEPDSPASEALRAQGIDAPGGYRSRVQLLEQLGVPATAIITPDALVRSTADEAVVARDWLREHPQPVLLVVTSLDHTARARMIFTRTIDPSTRVLMRGATHSRFRLETWWRDRLTLREGLIEWQKHWVYWIRY